MRERKVREIMARYLAEIGETFTLQKGAGPDILRNGAALEVKGSRFPLKKAMRQFAEYAFGYRNLAIALPLEAIGLRLLCELYVLEKAMHGNRASCRRSITLYLIAEPANQECFILEFSSAGGLLWRLLEKLGDECQGPAGRRLEEHLASTIAFLSKPLDSRLRCLIENEGDSLFAHKLRKP